MLVLFFIAFFSFRCMLIDRKLRPGQRCPVGVVFVSCLLSQELIGSNPAVRVIIFFSLSLSLPIQCTLARRINAQFFFQLLFTSFLLIRVRVSFSVKVRFTVTVTFNIVVGVVFDGTRK